MLWITWRFLNCSTIQILQSASQLRCDSIRTNFIRYLKKNLGYRDSRFWSWWPPIATKIRLQAFEVLSRGYNFWDGNIWYRRRKLKSPTIGDFSDINMRSKLTPRNYISRGLQFVALCNCPFVQCSRDQAWLQKVATVDVFDTFGSKTETLQFGTD